VDRKFRLVADRIVVPYCNIAKILYHTAVSLKYYVGRKSNDLDVNAVVVHTSVPAAAMSLTVVVTNRAMSYRSPATFGSTCRFVAPIPFLAIYNAYNIILLLLLLLLSDTQYYNIEYTIIFLLR